MVGIIDEAARRLARKFVFGYYTREDIFQEARLEALKGLKDWDTEKALLPFLLEHMHNRLCNLKRNKLRRLETPCKDCATGRVCRRVYPDGEVPLGEEARQCRRYITWRERNDLKAALVETVSILEGDERGGGNLVEEEMERGELERRIDEAIPVHLRADYLRLRQGEKISTKAHEAIKRIVREVLDGA